MKPRSIKYYFREAFSGLIKNRLMTIASIATVAACVFIMACSYCMVDNLRYMLHQMEDSIGIAVFLKGDMTGQEVEKLKETISAIDHVKEVKYVSPDDALDELKKEWGTEEGILEGFDGENNPLSNSFEISLDNIENQADVLAKLQKLEGIDNIRHAQTETEVLLKLNKMIKITGVLVIAILAAISIVIIFNTIKISVYTRRNEITIMKYVGATDWFIRWPFIIEGILIGFVGSVIPIGIAWPLYGKSVDLIYTYIPLIRNIATFKLGIEIFSKLFPIALLFGILLGVAGSVSSIRKYLKA
ncbi:MAG: ABC transporter permease [Epulopiscium sp.]|jgi:cell division transport system permease protein|nr:ABC transporter permease [Candidatus Epulonipiscium sp.]